ncbi:MAG: low molecular weight phosphotyrosine protein phosphatase [Saprospiraceae bacterium]|nr:low molecular weight phosphotyrosine protein phosphatase [Saprospiraceae bacterium]
MAMKILMVCLGNICRSPMAHGLMEEEINRLGLDWLVDSAGTNGYHDGEAPDPRAIKTMKDKGFDISAQISRKIQANDLEQFDLIVCMDSSIQRQILNTFKGHPNLSRVRRIMEFAKDQEHLEVKDPYYDNGFEEAYQRIRMGVGGIIHSYCKQN